MRTGPSTTTNRRRPLLAATAALLLAGTALAGAAAPGAAAAPTPESASATASASAASLPPLDRTALCRVLADVPNEEVSGALVRISGSAGEFRATSGVADLRTGRPVPHRARFRIGSISKTFTAAVVLRLADRGEVDLDGTVQQYLPGLLPDGFPDVTVRQLLNHTHGIPGNTIPHKDPDWFFEHRYDVFDPREVVTGGLRGAGGREVFAPGSAQQYGNTGYLVAGLVVEAVTGRPYAEVLEEEVLRPAGLRHTSLPSGPELRGPHARGYEAVETADGTRYVDITEASPSLPWAAGGMVSTAADLDRFVTALFRGEVVPKEQLAEMFTVPDVWKHGAEGKEKASYSVGLTRYDIGGLTVWGKSGDRPGYNNGVGATEDLSRRLVYSVNTLHMGGSQPRTAERIIAAALVPSGSAPDPDACRGVNVARG
ncbi:serine hydrolase domain-containing protein [Streptomyces sp. NPDC059637]|uniref:serine hydrolase domain-containing protein n=1 Tax=Streptomyces sp. NPDC059637 TaxID=3347752 RepID=UPI0036901E6D